MQQFKIKVYLGQKFDTQEMNGKAVPVVLTRWTYLLAGAREIWNEKRTNGEFVDYFYYRDCQPADGLAWTLFEMDGCVCSSDVEMPEKYEVFARTINEGINLVEKPELKEAEPEIAA